MISREAYLMGREKEYLPTQQMLEDAKTLLSRVHALFADLGIELHDSDVSSGYRPGHYNTAVGGAPKSTHVLCQAIDLKDHTRRLVNAILAAPHLLEKHGLYMEDPKHTKTWCHLDIRPRKKHIFTPY